MKQTIDAFPKFFATALIAGSLAACASAPKGNIDANANPSDEINHLNQDIQQGYVDQLDVTSNDEFMNAQKKLDKAKREIADHDKNSTVIDTLRESRGYLNQAMSRSTEVVPKAQGILDARNAALSAGVRNFRYEAKGLTMADQDFRSEVDRIRSGKLSSRRWSELQAEYMNLEIRTIQDAKLAAPQSQIAKAIDDGARDYAPNVLKRAEWDLQNARNVIATDRHNSQAIEPAVIRSTTSGQLLQEVMVATNKGKVPENTALQLVKDGRSIAALKTDLTEKNAQVSEADSQLRQQQAAISLDQALNHARKQFKSNEAEVYRQGDKLLIRLKGSNFASGKADLNRNSIPLMTKVQTIAANLHPQQIVIEGNTDSLGDEGLNMKLSQERAEAVATFFEDKGLDKDKIETVGYGTRKPLASNKTTTGRAQNRRVDIIITPSTVSEAASKNTETSM